MAGAYAGAQASLGTMHGKEAAIGRALRDTAGLDVIVPPGLDTDRFGTFTREIPRQGTMIASAVAKANLAMDVSGLSLGLASEGSYGPHPHLPMVPAGLELLVFVDRVRGLQVSEQMLTTEITFAHTVARDVEALTPFLAKVGFPRQQVIVRPASHPDAADGLTKGVADAIQLAEAFDRALRLSATGEVLVETDMRAFANPQRLATLGVLSRRLGERLTRLCPQCGAPGFGDRLPVAGRPCAACGVATDLPMAIAVVCTACGCRTTEALEPRTADPTQCWQCNP